MREDKDYIVGVPSGEIIHCRNSDIYDLVLSGLVKYREYYGNEQVSSYFFRDILLDDIIKIIHDNIKYGDYIEHKIFGKGRISGFSDKKGFYVYFSNKGINLEVDLDSFLLQKHIKLL
jgi:hypothetical protein